MSDADPGEDPLHMTSTRALPVITLIAITLASCAASDDELRSASATSLSSTRALHTALVTEIVQTKDPVPTLMPSPSPSPTISPTPQGGGTGAFMFWNRYPPALALGNLAHNEFTLLLTHQDLELLLGGTDEDVFFITPSGDPNYVLVSHCRNWVFVAPCWQDMSVVTLDPLSAVHLALPGGGFSHSGVPYALWKWLPDGSRLVAYDSPWIAPPSSTFYVINRDGSRLITHRTDGYTGEPYWTPDSSQIIWSDEGGTHILNADGSADRELDLPFYGDADLPGMAPYPNCISYSPSEERVAYTDHLGLAVFLAAADFSDVRPIMIPTAPFDRRSDTTYTGCTSKWSPDGKSLLVQFSGSCMDFTCTSSGKALIFNTITGDAITLDSRRRSNVVLGEGEPVCGWTPDSSLALLDVGQLTILAVSSDTSYVLPGHMDCPLIWYPRDDLLPPLPHPDQVTSFPAATPTVASWIATPPTLYDDFDSTDSVSTLWRITSDPSAYGYVIEDGSLNLTRYASDTGAGQEFQVAQPRAGGDFPRSIDEIGVFQAQLTLNAVSAEEENSGMGFVAIILRANTDPVWRTDCWLSSDTVSEAPVFHCLAFEGEKVVYGTSAETVAFGEPHTVAIDVNPDTGAVRYYLDGVLISAYQSEHYNQLVQARWSPVVALWGMPGIGIEAKVDNVMIGGYLDPAIATPLSSVPLSD